MATRISKSIYLLLRADSTTERSSSCRNQQASTRLDWHLTDEVRGEVDEIPQTSVGTDGAEERDKDSKILNVKRQSGSPAYTDRPRPAPSVPDASPSGSRTHSKVPQCSKNGRRTVCRSSGRAPFRAMYSILFLARLGSTLAQIQWAGFMSCCAKPHA